MVEINVIFWGSMSIASKT
jgi:hypothetical protein